MSPERGDRPAILPVHGWCGHPGFWRDQIPDLSRLGWTVAAVALPSGVTTIEGAAEAVVSVSARHGDAGVVLVGHSLGGAVAVEAAIRLGARCRLLVGVDTFTDGRFYRRRPDAEIRTRLQPFASDFTAAMTRMVEAITRVEARPGLRAWIAREMGRAHVPSALASMESLLRWDIEARWPLLPCPAETINSARLSEGIETVDLSGLTVHAMPRVGHFPMLEDPSAFSRLLHDLLARQHWNA